MGFSKYIAYSTNFQIFQEKKTHTQKPPQLPADLWLCDVHFSNVVFSVLTYWREMLNGFEHRACPSHISRNPTRSPRLRGPRTNWQRLANFNGSICFNKLLEETTKANNISFSLCCIHFYPIRHYHDRWSGFLPKISWYQVPPPEKTDLAIN